MRKKIKKFFIFASIQITHRHFTSPLLFSKSFSSSIFENVKLNKSQAFNCSIAGTRNIVPNELIVEKLSSEPEKLDNFKLFASKIFEK